MEQYFTPNPLSKSNPRSIELDYRGRRFIFKTDSGVFSKDGLDEGSRVLLDSLGEAVSGRVLDIGCGWGPVGIIVAALNPNASLCFSDVNERALKLTEENLRLNHISAQVLQSDGFERLEGFYDHILFNPPIRSGKENIYRLFRESADHLSPSGYLHIVIRKQQGAESAQRYLSTLFTEVIRTARSSGYHVLRCFNPIKNNQ